MQKKLPIRYLISAIVLLCLVWWLWPSTERGVAESNDTSGVAANKNEQRLVSAIQPIEDAAALSIQSDEISDNYLDSDTDKQIKDKFNLARKLASQGDRNAAIDAYIALTREHPKYLEPYINLASLYAGGGDLDYARKIIIRGMNANNNNATLYKNLQKVHGALAANAYQAALAEEGEVISSVELPLLDNIVFARNKALADKSVTQEIQKYKTQLGVTDVELKRIKAELTQRNSELANTKNDLNESQLKLQAMLVTSNSDSAESTTQREEVLALQTQLDQATQEIASMQNQHKTELASLRQQLVIQNTLVANEQSKQGEPQQTQASQQHVTLEQERKQNEQYAISLVKSWASAWSEQQVDDYVAHYVDGYSPSGSGLNHASWLDQRQIRLTNKQFIKVDVSAFAIKPSKDQFTVTFSQHYRSNTMDDTIRKQLLFEIVDNDWSKAKIIGETVIR